MIIPSSNSLLKTIKVIYLYVLPSIIVILLLGVSQFINRPKLFRSDTVDLVIRILFCLWFSFGYRRLLYISKYRPTPVSSWTKADIDIVEKLFYISGGVFFGIMITIFTRWIILVFLPLLAQISIVLAIINGLIYAVPIIVNYHALKP
jgi:hypothetical protein